jgi:hypothetical protein
MLIGIMGFVIRQWADGQAGMHVTAVTQSPLGCSRDSSQQLFPTAVRAVLKLPQATNRCEKFRSSKTVQ